MILSNAAEWKSHCGTDGKSNAVLRFAFIRTNNKSSKILWKMRVARLHAEDEKVLKYYWEKSAINYSYTPVGS